MSRHRSPGPRLTTANIAEVERLINRLERAATIFARTNIVPASDLDLAVRYLQRMLPRKETTKGEHDA
jgi:hypothetical protein